jgi:hypothetical protein
MFRDAFDKKFVSHATELSFCMPGKKTKKDTMIQDGPPDIPDNI